MMSEERVNYGEAMLDCGELLFSSDSDDEREGGDDEDNQGGVSAFAIKGLLCCAFGSCLCAVDAVRDIKRGDVGTGGIRIICGLALVGGSICLMLAYYPPAECFEDAFVAFNSTSQEQGDDEDEASPVLSALAVSALYCVGTVTLSFIAGAGIGKVLGWGGNKFATACSDVAESFSRCWGRFFSAAPEESLIRDPERGLLIDDGGAPSDEEGEYEVGGEYEEGGNEEEDDEVLRQELEAFKRNRL